MGSVQTTEPAPPPKPSVIKRPHHADAPPKFNSAAEIDAFVDEVFPGPHRCNPRLDDFLMGFMQFPPAPQGTFRTFVRCARSTPGQEPTTPFKHLPADYTSVKAAQVKFNRDLLRRFYLDQAIMREEQEITYAKKHPQGENELTAQNLAPRLLGPNSSGSRGYDATGTRSYPAIMHEEDQRVFNDSTHRTRFEVISEMRNRPEEVEARRVQQVKRDAFLAANPGGGAKPPEQAPGDQKRNEPSKDIAGVWKT